MFDKYTAMTRLQLVGLAGIAAQLTYAHPHRPMGAFTLADLKERDGNDQFVFAAIGDSWGVRSADSRDASTTDIRQSGVQYGGDTYYDDNSSGCQRLKNAWATVVRDEGPIWGPEGFPPQLCFEACSGRSHDDERPITKRIADLF